MSVARRRVIPSALFLESEVGNYSDITTYATNYFSDAGTTPAALEDTIQQINDQSGNAINWSQATAGSRPLLTTDGGFPVLSFASSKSLSCTLAADTYTIVVPTRSGIWIDGVVHAGGTFTVGPTTYTGGPAGLLSVIGNKLIGPPQLLDRQLTAAEKAAWVQWFQNRGAGALYVLGEELKGDLTLLNTASYDADLDEYTVIREGSVGNVLLANATEGNYLIDVENLSGDQFVVRVNTTTTVLVVNTGVRDNSFITHSSGDIRINHPGAPRTSVLRVHSLRQLTQPGA